MSTKIELATLNGGMALDMFNEELKKVMSNIEDENTSATQKRKVVLTVDFKPDNERKLGVATISVKSHLAPIIPQGKSVYFDMTKTTSLQRLRTTRNSLMMITAKRWG